jgi:glucose-6-phosphate isomerase
VSVLAPAELVERIWARDATVWTGADEAQWLGWLDEPARMRERIDELLAFAADADFDDLVVLGMGGSSLAPLVLAKAFRPEGGVHVLDTTHPTAIRRLESALDLERTLFVVSSKSGTTVETRSQHDYFRARGGRFVAVTDPGSQLAEAEGLDHVFHGEPTIGGRYSALSPFGLVPAALMGAEVDRLLDRAEEMREACRLADGNPGLELGRELAETPLVRVQGGEYGFALWAEQLLAESTGKDGKGIVPVVQGGSPVEARLPAPDELGQEFFRWEFATAAAGALLGVNPFDQPNVQEAKDRTQAVLAAGGEPELEPEGDLDALLAGARDGDWVAVQAFIDPAREAELEPLLARIDLPYAVGLGPRYLHSTGQLHKGGPDTVIAVQVVDDLGEELPISGRDFGFRKLIAAQAAGDFQALQERGRRVCRVRL